MKLKNLKEKDLYLIFFVLNSFVLIIVFLLYQFHISKIDSDTFVEILEMIRLQNIQPNFNISKIFQSYYFKYFSFSDPYLHIIKSATFFIFIQMILFQWLAFNLSKSLISSIIASILFVTSNSYLYVFQILDDNLFQVLPAIISVGILILFDRKGKFKSIIIITFFLTLIFGTFIHIQFIITALFLLIALFLKNNPRFINICYTLMIISSLIIYFFLDPNMFPFHLIQSKIKGIGVAYMDWDVYFFSKDRLLEERLNWMINYLSIYSENVFPNFINNNISKNFRIILLISIMFYSGKKVLNISNTINIRIISFLMMSGFLYGPVFEPGSPERIISTIPFFFLDILSIIKSILKKVFSFFSIKNLSRYLQISVSFCIFVYCIFYTYIPFYLNQTYPIPDRRIVRCISENLVYGDIIFVPRNFSWIIVNYFNKNITVIFENSQIKQNIAYNGREWEIPKKINNVYYLPTEEKNVRDKFGKFKMEMPMFNYKRYFFDSYPKNDYCGIYIQKAKIN